MARTIECNVLSEHVGAFRKLFAFGLTDETLDVVIRKGLSRVAAEQRFRAKHHGNPSNYGRTGGAK